MPLISGGQINLMVRRGRSISPRLSRLKGARHFKYRRRARSVIIGAGFLMAEMARKDDLFICSVRAGNHRRHNVVMRGAHLGFHNGSKHDRFAAREPLSVFARAAKRNHKSEFVIRDCKATDVPTLHCPA